jgi:hypothetical protein
MSLLFNRLASPNSALEADALARAAQRERSPHQGRLCR